MKPGQVGLPLVTGATEKVCIIPPDALNEKLYTSLTMSIYEGIIRSERDGLMSLSCSLPSFVGLVGREFSSGNPGFPGQPEGVEGGDEKNIG